MIALVTGDVFNSRGLEPRIWLDDLKLASISFGDEPSSWFFLEEKAFNLMWMLWMLYLRANSLITPEKQLKNIDVRLAIGIGEVSYKSSVVAEYNSSAYVNSGESFYSLKKQNLTIKSPWINFDRSMNIIIQFAILLLMVVLLTWL